MARKVNFDWYNGLHGRRRGFSGLGRLAALGDMYNPADFANNTDSTQNDDGSTTYYYDSGAQIIVAADGVTMTYIDPAGNVVDPSQVAASTPPAPITTSLPASGASDLGLDPWGNAYASESTDSAGNTTYAYADGSSSTVNAGGALVTYKPSPSGTSSTYIPKAAITQTPGATVTMPAGSTSAQTQAMLNQLATAGGTWLARAVGGSTILTRSSTGGLSTFNLGSLAMPALLIGALFMLEKSSKGNKGSNGKKRK